MEYPNKFVEFDEYCKICKFKRTKYDQEPCNECLSNPVNLHSRKPVNFEKMEIKKKPIRKIKKDN